jgi:16S rRNA (guanine527-N7)-methyltransferase
LNGPLSNQARLRAFAELVTRWSVRINLVGKRDLPYLWERHIQDSLALIPYIPAGTDAAIDLGSGAGFPGLVLAIETGIPFTLIESDGRKSAFLTEAARASGAPVKVLNARIEAAETRPAPLITARALAPLDRLLALAAPHLAEGGFCLFPKGRTYEDELKAAEPHWRMTVERCKNPFDAEACILKLGQIHHAGQPR